MVILTSTMLPTQLNPNHLILLPGPEQLFQSIMARKNDLPNPIITDIMDIHLLIMDMDIMVLVLLLMLDVLSGELENKFLLYLQLNKKCFIHILQKKPEI